jgi:hypothetical protein
VATYRIEHSHGRKYSVVDGTSNNTISDFRFDRQNGYVDVSVASTSPFKNASLMAIRFWTESLEGALSVKSAKSTFRFN